MAHVPKVRSGAALAVSNFTSNLDGLREFVGMVGKFLDQEHTAFLKERRHDLIPMALGVSSFTQDAAAKLSPEKEAQLRQQFAAPVEISKNEHGKGVSIRIKGNAGERFEKAMQGLHRASAHIELLHKNCLISLISSAEWLLSQMLRRFFEAHPEAAGLKEKSLTLEDLRKLGSLEDAEKYLITLRVDEIMWGSFEDWIKYLKGSVKLTMPYLDTEIDQVVEIFQRRNTMVHNNGIVHSSYLSKVPESLRKGIEIGRDLMVPREYVNASIDIIERVFILIASELWRKSDASDMRRSESLTEFAVEAIVQERYVTGERISAALKDDPKVPERLQIMSRLNYWQSLKWQNRFDEIRGEVENVDFSAKDELFQLGRLVLLDNFKDATPLAITAFDAKKVGLNEFERWPIFRHFKSHPEMEMFLDQKKAIESKTVFLPNDVEGGDMQKEETSQEEPLDHKFIN